MYTECIHLNYHNYWSNYTWYFKDKKNILKTVKINVLLLQHFSVFLIKKKHRRIPSNFFSIKNMPHFFIFWMLTCIYDIVDMLIWIYNKNKRWRFKKKVGLLFFIILMNIFQPMNMNPYLCFRRAVNYKSVFQLFRCCTKD